MQSQQPINIFWFRRDLRLDDNTALYHALASGKPVLPIFIFDKNILDKLDNKQDARVHFIHQSLKKINEELNAIGSGLTIFHETPSAAFHALINQYSIDAVYTNHDYESYGIERDLQIHELLEQHNISFKTYKDQVVFEKNEVVKEDGTPYTVFTPYSKKWKTVLQANPIVTHDSQSMFHRFISIKTEFPTLESIGFSSSFIEIPSSEINANIIKDYADMRNFPGINSTSKLGVHLRFGTISIRKLALETASDSEVFLNELIWREFYHMILWHFPQVSQGKSFKPAYDQIQWRHDEAQFKLWSEGKTGYPIVDAGMRELNATGFMHNRSRMIVASFLCKHLLIDWRWGEAYFAEKLLDFDFAANNGGWQWAAGSGCDAAPYFRVFNPYLQTQKFDPNFTYIKKWVPEFQEFGYPAPIVDHEMARKRCLETYKSALGK